MARAWPWSSSACSDRRRCAAPPTPTPTSRPTSPPGGASVVRRAPRTSTGSTSCTRRTSPASSASSWWSCGSSIIGDTRSPPARSTDLLAARPGVARRASRRSCVAVGLRSGSRGGPLALERAEVRHVLLAPVDRTTALRAPAIRQLRFLALRRHRSRAPSPVSSPPTASRARTLAWVAHRRAGRRHARGARRGHGAGGVAASGCRAGWPPLLGVVLVGAEPSPTALGVDPVQPHASPSASWCSGRWSGHRSASSRSVVGVGARGASAWLGSAAPRSRPPSGGRTSSASSGSPPRCRTCARSSCCAGSSRWSSRGCGRGSGCAVRGNRPRAGVHPRASRACCAGRPRGSPGSVLLGVIAGLALRGVWAGTTPLVLARRARDVRRRPRHRRVARPGGRPPEPPRRARRSTPGLIHLRHVPMGVVGQALVAAIAMAVAAAPGGGQVPADVAAVAVAARWRSARWPARS